MRACASSVSYLHSPRMRPGEYPNRSARRHSSRNSGSSAPLYHKNPAPAASSSHNTIDVATSGPHTSQRCGSIDDETLERRPTAAPLSAHEISWSPSSQQSEGANHHRPSPMRQAPADHANIVLWEDNLLHNLDRNLGFPTYGSTNQANNWEPQPIPDAPETEDIVFTNLQNEFPDADVLEQYLNYANVFDPSLTDPLVADAPSVTPSCHTLPAPEEGYAFKSPFAWVADWSTRDSKTDERYAELVEQRVFNLPPIPEITELIQLYFSHAHHRLPVINEHYFYRLTQACYGKGLDRDLTPVSLALLYAIMFFACSVSGCRIRCG